MIRFRIASLLILAWMTTLCSGQVLLFDDFSGSGRVDQSIWRLPFGGDGAFYGRTLAKTDTALDYPTVSGGVATLQLDTFLDDGTGASAGVFSGGELHSKRNFVVGGGLRFEARARLSNPVPGLVGGVFLFDVQRLNSNGNLVRDEIDHELLSNNTQQVFTNYWNDGSFAGPDAGGDPSFHSPTSFDMTQFHDYRVDWRPNRIDWYVDDNLIRSQTSNVPDDPMQVRMNLWAPDDVFAQAYNAGLQPAASAAANQSYFMEIDEVQVTQLNTMKSANLLSDPSFDDPSVPFFNLSQGDTPDLAATNQWVAFNNAQISGDAALTGSVGLAMWGPFSGNPDASGIFQNVDASPGDVFEASVFAQSKSTDSIRGQANYTALKVEFLNANGDVIPGLGEFIGANGKENVILEGRDPDMPEDSWIERQVNAVAPAGATKARMSLLFVQLENGAGATLFDDLSLVKLTSTQLSGDFTGDSDYTCEDVDLLVAEIASANNTASFDLTGDGQVNGDDLTAWLAEAGAAKLPSGAPYLVGDTNLDGSVDVSDRGLWNANKFTQTNAWCKGDFNADGFTDVTDLSLQNANMFMTSGVMAAVPEPQSWVLLAGISVMFLGAGRRRASSSHRARRS